ncbi:MAG: CHASE2 domain-containing protein [Okeania sp. SIO3B5]|uniref:CHASE2 domain-containing protein n=1 Tax=Okeania sp. SIO3B5 TaxID=2607811 RepID=UPI00140030AC|nr:CHASE2 domain-containing protein [Okeania sp. SIO3B5]NEO56357.1 CHASE2 domain-containing protein [Okeania sp. SIO3B5]
MFKLFGSHQNTILKNIKHWLIENRRLLLTASTSAGIVILLRSFGLLQSWEWTLYDYFFRLRPTEPLDPRIVIVGIDESDIQKYGYPINDQLMAEILQKLHSLQPRAIGLDIYRDFPREPGYKNFVKALENIPNIIGIERIGIKDSLGIKAPEILAQKQQVGFNNILTDADGKIRRGFLYMHLEDGNFRESFPLKLALNYLKKEGIEPKAANKANDLQLGLAVFRRLKINDGAYIRVDAGGYQILANPRKISDGFHIVSMNDLLSGKITPNLFKDRIIIIGYTATSVKDFHRNSYSSSLFNAPKEVSGVELQANFLSQILSSALDGRVNIKVFPEPIEWLLIISFSYIGANLSWQLLLPKKSIITILFISINLIGFSYIAFVNGWWFPIVPSIFALNSSAVMILFHLAHLKEEWQKSTEFLQSVINAIPDPIFVKDKYHRRIVLNEAYGKFIGYSVDDLLIKTDYELFPQNEASIFWQQDELVFQTNQQQENEESFTDARGITHIIATKRTLHQDAAGNLFLVGVIRDITERKKIEENLKETATKLKIDNDKLKLLGDSLHHQANHDPLTGLPNRKQFHERLSQAIEWANLNEQMVGLLFLDLNGFKAVNDTLGHNIGDLLLKLVAQRLQGCLRGSDTVSRLGGDEFTVVLPGIPGKLGASRVADKIRSTINQPFELEDHIVPVGTSIGISIYPLDGREIDQLIHHADTAMYEDKKQQKEQR